VQNVCRVVALWLHKRWKKRCPLCVIKSTSWGKNRQVTRQRIEGNETKKTWTCKFCIGSPIASHSIICAFCDDACVCYCICVLPLLLQFFGEMKMCVAGFRASLADAVMHFGPVANLSLDWAHSAIPSWPWHWQYDTRVNLPRCYPRASCWNCMRTRTQLHVRTKDKAPPADVTTYGQNPSPKQQPFPWPLTTPHSLLS